MPVVPEAAPAGGVVGDLVNRVLNEHIHPISESPLVALLSSDINSTTTSVDINLDLLAIDERDILAPATVVEIGYEQILLRTVVASGNTATCTVVRGWQGTTPASHDTDDAVTISPDVTRLTVFRSVSDEIVSLFPSLWRIDSETVAISSTYSEVSEYAQQVEHFRYLNNGKPVSLSVQLIKNFSASSTGNAIRFNEVPLVGQSGEFTFRASFPRPLDEADALLTTLGIQVDWHAIIVFGAAARAVMSLDPRKLQVEWISEAVESESVPAGTPSAIAGRLQRMRDAELDAANRRWRAVHPTRVTVSNPLRPGAG